MSSEEISRIMSAQEGLEKVMGDVIRVLYLSLGSLWMPELVAELVGFRETLEEAPPKEDEVKKAVAKLRELGIVYTEEGIKASLSGRNIKTYLVRLKRSPELNNALLLDERIHKYREIWRRAFQV